jgi:hypothetical protein
VPTSTTTSAASNAPDVVLTLARRRTRQ